MTTHKHILNVETGDFDIVEMTADELTQYEKDIAEIRLQQAKEKEVLDKRQKVLDKLGLTAEEAAVLLG